MKKVLIIDGCIRGSESRTLKIADAFLDEIQKTNEAEIERVNLNEARIEPLFEDTLQTRENALGDWSNPVFSLATELKRADLIVLAAPFWEGTFPSAVHAYIENICVSGLTFELTENGYQGLCKAKNAVFITTRGGIYETGEAKKNDHAEAFLTTVFNMLGIEKLYTVSAEGLDIIGADVKSKVETAEKQAKALASEIR